MVSSPKVLYRARSKVLCYKRFSVDGWSQMREIAAGGTDRTDKGLMMSEARVDYEVRDRVARLTLNQPHKLNAMSFDMWAALPALVARAVADDHVRAIAVEGAGAKAF